MPDINKHLEQFGRKQPANQRQTDVNIKIPINSLRTFDVVAARRICFVNNVSLYAFWGGVLGFGYFVGIQMERSEFERVKRFEACWVLVLRARRAPTEFLFAQEHNPVVINKMGRSPYMEYHDMQEGRSPQN